MLPRPPPERDFNSNFLPGSEALVHFLPFLFGSKIVLFNFSFFGITGQGIDLDYHDIEWFALEMNRGHSVIFEIASKYCISDSC